MEKFRIFRAKVRMTFHHKTPTVNVMPNGEPKSATVTRHVTIEGQGKKQGESQGHSKT